MLKKITVNRKKFSFLFLLLPMLTLAQESIGMPPSPTVASLVSIAKDSVNNSGKVVHNIPIFNMKLRNHSFPIGLTYSSSGVKVEETPSYVGTGWNLSAGGVITRSVMDHPDDLISADHGSGILHTNIMSQIENFSTQIENGGYNEVASGHFFRYNINGDNMETRNDTQPDLFYFSFFGRSGKFVFNKDKEIVSLSNDNLKFSHTLDADGSLKTFTITDTNGTRYLFSEREYSKTHYNSDSQWEFLSSRAKRQRQLNFYSSWHLKSVTITTNPNLWTTVSHDPLEMVFNYEDETIAYQIKNSEMGKICVDQQCEDTNIVDTSNYDLQNSTANSTTDYIINSKKISSIVSDYFNISFDNTNRADLNGGLKLSTVQIKDLNDDLVKKIDFQYDYFLSPNMPTSNNFEYKRLRLDAVLVNDQFFQEFEYYSSYALPHRKSTEQDFWGYFNDNNATSLVPKVYTTFNGQSPEYHIFPPLNEAVVYEYGSVDRNVNPLTIHMGMLKKIEYQTAGHKTFFYEPNDFTLNAYTASGSAIKGNGVRVDRIEYFDGDDVESLDYSYNSPSTGFSSGRVSHLPKFATHIPWNFVYEFVPSTGARFTSPFGHYWSIGYYWNQYNGNSYQCISASGGGTWNYSPTNNPSKYFAMTTRRFSSSQIALASNISDPLVYEHISIKEGDNGKKLYNFNILGGLDVSIPTEFDISKFNRRISYKTYYWQSVISNAFQTTPNCLQNIGAVDPVTLQQFNSNYQYVNTSGESHPFAPKPNWNKYFGQLKNYTYLNEDGFKVFKEEYEYDLKGNIANANTEKKVVSLKYRLFNRPIGFAISSNFEATTGPTAWVWSFYDVYHGIGLSPTSITRTNYYNDEAISISKTTNNIYVHGNLLASASFDDSKGNTHKTRYRYSLDFQAGTTNFWQDEFGNWHQDEVPNMYKSMTQRNMIYPIEIVEEINDNVVSAQIHEYTASSAGIFFEKTYKLETPNYAYDYTPASAQSNSSSRILIKDSNMVERYSNDRFDANGNVLQETTKDDEPIITIWGYNRSLPIARIVGAKYTDVNTWFLNEYNETLDYLNTVSNNDVNSNGEYNLRSWLNKLRTVVNNNSNGNIQIATFTYNPLVGITSIIDVNGKISYYEYDEFNRLINIKDKDGNILSETQYNYKSQN